MRILLFAGVCLAAVSFGQTGTVKSEGQPIPGATVKATQGERILLTVTDANGAFQFDRMAAGMWNVEATQFGFDTARKEVNITSTPLKIDFTITLRAGTRAFDRNQAQVDTSEAIAAPPPELPVAAES